MQIEFSMMEGNRTVVAHVRVNHIVYKGEARCHPNDKFNYNIGQRLAAGRALEQAGRILTTVANAAVDAGTEMSWCRCEMCDERSLGESYLMEYEL